MNRRRLLVMLPLAPIAALLPAAPEPIDTRPTFRLSEYVLWVPEQTYACEIHGVNHGVYVHGCQPIAWIPSQMALSGSPLPATPDAIPCDVVIACQIGGEGRQDFLDPHQHHDFRWID